jgi:hypothetical protein
MSDQYHLSMKSISRKSGRSSTAAAAYRSGELIIDERTGEVHDYRRKRGVLYSQIVLPGGGTIPRAALWNAVEIKHKRGDAVLVREIEIALPAGLDAAQRKALVEQYAQELADRYGVAVDVAIHAPHPVTDADLERDPNQYYVEEIEVLDDGHEIKRRHNGNWHGHVSLSACHFDAAGVPGKKCVELDQIHCQRAKIANAADVERPRWAELANAALAAAGSADRIDHRSHAARGIDRVPTVHRGVHANAVERKTGKPSRRRLYSQQLAAEAAQAEADVAAEIAALISEIEAELADAVAERDAELAQAVSQAAAYAAAAAVPVIKDAAPAAVLRAAVAAAAAPEVVVSQAAAPQAPDVPAVVVAEIGPLAAVPAPSTAERLAKLRERREKASQVADQAARRAAPYWLAEAAATQARQRLDALAAERQEREQAIADRPWLHRLAALPADPDKKRIAEIIAEASKAQAALKRAEVALGKSKPLHDAQVRADAAVDSLDRAVKTAERQCKVEAERLRIAGLIERQADSQGQGGPVPGSGISRS